MEKQHHSVGKMLGSYYLIGELASGVSSQLFLARSASAPEHKVVVKLLLSTPVYTQQEQERFLQEVRLHQRLHHPHILPILNAGIDQTTPYIVIPYAPDGSLYSRLHETSSAPLARAETLTITSQIGQALLYAHRHNVFHGNLKPQNILFTGEGRAVLADFAFYTLKTTSGNPASTLPYAAPELLTGSASKESDQYALGCIIYEMFTGKAPFSAKETGAVPGSRPRPMLAQLKARLPQDLSLIVLKAIAREPLQRYRDVQDFLNALGALTITEPGADHQKDVMLFQQEDLLVTPIAFSSPSLPKEEWRANEVVTSIPVLEAQLNDKNSGVVHSLGRASSTEWSKLYKIGQLQSIKEWPLIAIAAVIIILSILGTLTFGGLSTASQSNANPPNTATVHVSTPIQSTLITPTVVVTSTAQPSMGQRVKPNPTPTPTSTPTPPPVSPTTSGFLSVSPGGFSPANCASVSDHFVCTATLSLSNKATRVTIWYTSSKNAETTFTPASGFLFPGQSVQITINIPRNCPGNSTLLLITSRATFAIPWSC